jgi:hypothetical protein
MALITTAGLLPAPGAQAAAGRETASAAAEEWYPAGFYDSKPECENAGIRGQNKRWWVDYYCYRRSSASYVLNVQYN